MPQYRIEISPNNRAGCKDSVCNKEKVKITKGEIRFGTWVEIQEHGSWAWKHWGCVSGSQLQNLKDDCDQGNGDWDFDTIDGFDEINDPDVQEKIRRCVKQAHIDPEDFKGDPEKNKPGEKGIHLTAKQKAAKEQAAAEAAEEESEDAKPKKAAKRGRKNVDEQETEDEPKAKKTKTKKPAQPAKAATAAPATKSRGRKGARLEESEEEVDEEEEDEEEEEEEEEEEKPVRTVKTKSKASTKTADPQSSSRSRRSSARKAVATEESPDEKPALKTKRRRSSRGVKA